MLRLQILGHMGRGCRHGYAVAKEHRARTGLSSGFGSFYRELRILQDAGYIRRTSDGAGSDPRKVTYEITEAGEADLHDWLEAVEDVSPCPESDVAMRAPFLDRLPLETALSILDEWKRSVWEAIRRIEDARPRAGARREPDPMRDLLIRRRARHLTLELEFLEELAETLREKSADAGTSAAPKEKRVSRARSRAARGTG